MYTETDGADSFTSFSLCILSGNYVTGNGMYGTVIVTLSNRSSSLRVRAVAGGYGGGINAEANGNRNSISFVSCAVMDNTALAPGYGVPFVLAPVCPLVRSQPSLYCSYRRRRRHVRCR